jgi:hypothetical protein
MPARNRLGLSEATRLRIKTTALVNALQDFVFGKREMTSTQVQAARILLAKTLPDLAAVQMDVAGDVKVEVLLVNRHEPDKKLNQVCSVPTRKNN